MAPDRPEVGPPPDEAPTRREVVGYCMFDFANSSYTTLISTVAYSVYFRQAVVGGSRGDFLWSLASSLALVILILTAPLLGALADYSGRKKRFLLLTTIQTVVACALLGLVGPGDVVLGTLIYIVATLGFEGGYVFYNAFLPEVSTPQTIGRVSGWSWGVGFVGGLVSLVACLWFLRTPLLDASQNLNPTAVTQYRMSFVVVALFFALFSIPTFMFLRERGKPSPLGGIGDYVTVGFRRVGQTLGHLREYRETAKFVLGALFFHGGIETVIKFSAIYAAVTFHIEGLELLRLFIFTNIVAVPGTLVAGYVADWIGGKRALLLTLTLWVVLLLLGASTRTKVGFWVMAAGIAIGMGSTQAIARSFMAQLAPRSRESEFFGFYILCSKVGSILSLLLFGMISSVTGDQRMAVLSVAPFFIVGILIISTIRPAPPPTAVGAAATD